MKKNLDDLYNDEVDKLLFDYLEGSLGNDISAELEDKLAYDSNLQEELRYWKEAYVEQDFYDTSVLESQLKQVTKDRRKISTENYFLLIVTMASLLSFMPFSIERAPLVADELQINEMVGLNVETPEPLKTSLEEDDMAIKANKRIPEIKQNKEALISVSDVEVRNHLKLEILEPLPLKNGGNEAIIYPEKLIVPFAFTNKSAKEKPLYVSKTSRKEQRAIEKAKEKALQKRIEEKYMRGRKPYVVPLNPNF